MLDWINQTIDKLSNFLATRKGLLPILGIFLIVINFIFQFLPEGFIRESNLFLHLGILLGFVGFLLARAL